MPHTYQKYLSQCDTHHSTTFSFGYTEISLNTSIASITMNNPSPYKFDFSIGDRVEIEIDQFGESATGTVVKHYSNGDIGVRMDDDNELLRGPEYRAYKL